jgi:hypothetical protein
MYPHLQSNLLNQCNGLQPCNTCTKRSFECIYHDRDAQSPSERQLKRVKSLDENQPGSSADGSPIKPDPHHRAMPPSPLPTFHQSFAPQQSSPLQPRNGPQATSGVFSSVTADESAQRAARSLQQFSLPRKAPDDRTKSFLSIVTGLSGHEGEALVYGQSRMLQDSTGRLRK